MFLKIECYLIVLGIGGYLVVVIIGLYIGYLISVVLIDCLGCKCNFILFVVGLMVVVLVYMQLEVIDNIMLLFGLLLGFFVLGIFVGMGVFLIELFLMVVCGLGQGFCYNVGWVVGVCFLFLIGQVSVYLFFGYVIGIFVVGVYGLFIVVVFMLLEMCG